MFDRCRSALVLFPLFSFLALAAAPEAQRGVAPPAAGLRYLRLVEEDEGRVLRLEVAIRTFVPAEGTGPEISLVAATHIGEADYYAELQGYLDEQDVVIYEGVRPAGTGPLGFYLREPDDEARARITQGRLRFLAVLLEGYFEMHDAYPADIDELAAGAPLDQLPLLDMAVFDAWERPVRFVLASPARRGKYDLVSLGADGKHGGNGVAADLFFSDQAPLTAAELGSHEGIQKDLADAMGLVFQLEAMDHTGPSWINRDLAVDQIEERLGLPQDGEELFGLLSGESLLSGIASKALRFVGSTAIGSATLKLVGIEVLSRADEILTAAPAGMGNLMEVLIAGRNEVVVAELRDLMEMGSDVHSVGVIYGAGHMRDLEERIIREFGYRPQYEYWFRAVELDVESIGIPLRQVGWIRSSIRKALDLPSGG